jgi:hypothetical protein
MHDLIPLGPALPGALTTPPRIDATMGYAAAETAQATRQAYASDWRRDFAAWCASRGATALPAHRGIIAAYLSSLADAGRKASTIGRRVAAIGYHHKMAGHEPPTNQEGVKDPSQHRCRQRGQGPSHRGRAEADAGAVPRHAHRQAGPRAADARLRRCLPAGVNSARCRWRIWWRRPTACA